MPKFVPSDEEFQEIGRDPMAADEFNKVHWRQAYDEGWMLVQVSGDDYMIVASGRTLAASVTDTIQALVDLDRSWVAAVALRAIYEGTPCHVEALRIHYAGLNPILMDLPFVKMEGSSTLSYNRDTKLPEFDDGMSTSTELKPVERWVWHTGVVRYGVGGQRIETGIGEVQIRITGEKKTMDLDTFARMVRAAMESQLNSAMMIFKEKPGSAAAYAGLESAMKATQWLRTAGPDEIFPLLHEVGIGQYERLIVAKFDSEVKKSDRKVSLRVKDLSFKPISEGLYPRYKYLLLMGPSGYSGTPYRYIVAKFDDVFRPLQPWVDYAGDSILDGGEMPTHWVDL